MSPSTDAFTRKSNACVNPYRKPPEEIPQQDLSLGLATAGVKALRKPVRGVITHRMTHNSFAHASQRWHNSARNARTTTPKGSRNVGIIVAATVNHQRTTIKVTHVHAGSEDCTSCRARFVDNK